MTIDGRLLAYTSPPETLDVDRTVASVAAHAFSEYQSTVRSSFDRPHTLEFLLFEMEVRPPAPRTRNGAFSCFTNLSLRHVDMRRKKHLLFLHLRSYALPLALQEGKLALTSVHDRYLLCCYVSNDEADLGSLKMKVSVGGRYAGVWQLGACH